MLHLHPPESWTFPSAHLDEHLGLQSMLGRGSSGSVEAVEEDHLWTFNDFYVYVLFHDIGKPHSTKVRLPSGKPALRICHVGLAGPGTA